MEFLLLIENTFDESISYVYSIYFKQALSSNIVQADTVGGVSEVLERPCGISDLTWESNLYFLGLEKMWELCAIGRLVCLLSQHSSETVLEEELALEQLPQGTRSWLTLSVEITGMRCSLTNPFCLLIVLSMLACFIVVISKWHVFRL